MKMVDITGHRYGRLVAARKTERRSGDGTFYWVCFCDCGACTAASEGQLDSGGAVSCGCHLQIGKVYGWLTVLDITQGNARCRCVCGREITLPRTHLGGQSSCGCARGSRAYIDGQISLFPAENAFAL